jgi:hypothetical protein
MSARAYPKQAEIRIAGKTLRVPSAEIFGRTVVVKGKWIRIAKVKDEEVVEGASVQDPKTFLACLKESQLRVDCFTFAQRPPETKPNHNYHLEWDNWAAVNTTCFQDWWENLPQESRKNVRRAAKRGVVVKIVPLSDNLVRGILNIYNETPLRQGKRFWHFGKDFETVKRELATYLERSEFIGAYWNDELIGFIKMVYVDRVATLFHIVSMNEHHDKRPMNALIAKAVEHCEQKGISHFIYGQFLYGNKRQSSLLEFKRRNGFEQIDFPRYFVPLTLRGRIFVGLKLYRGITGLVPEPLLQAVLDFRAWCGKMVASKAALQRKKLAGVAQR